MGDLIVKQINELTPIVNDYYAQDNIYSEREEWNSTDHVLNIFLSNSFNKNNFYHIGFNIELISSEQRSLNLTFKIKIKNSSNNEYQYIQKIKLIANGQTSPLINFFFQPLKDGFDIISLELEDTNYLIDEVSVFDGSIYAYYLTNILENMNILKIGLQGDSNDIFCINGETLSLPKNGIFELNSNDLEIRSFYKLGYFDNGGWAGSINTLVIKPFTLNYIEEINN